MRKFLVLSVVVFFIVVGIETLGFDYTIRGHLYYAATGHFGDGHDLAILILRPLTVLGDAALPIFVNFMFALSVYFLLKPFVKYPEWAFVLAPITPLATIYAQILAIAMFNFMLVFYFRYNKEIVKNTKKYYRTILPPLFLILVFLTHWWSGLFVAGAFALYLFLSDHPDKTSLFSTIIITVFFFLFMSQPIGFLTRAPTVVLPDHLTTAEFFVIMSRGLSFFFLSFGGLWRLYAKSRGFFKINLLLFTIPLFIVFVLPTSNYWDWRLFYFMPFLALVSALMSYLFEGKSTT